MFINFLQEEENDSLRPHTFYVLYDIDYGDTLVFYSSSEIYGLNNLTNGYDIYALQKSMQEVEVTIDYKIPRNYKSVSKSMVNDYQDREIEKIFKEFSGTFMGISIVTGSKYIFITSEDDTDNVIMLDNNSVVVVSKQHVIDNFRYYLLADDVEDFLDLEFTIRNKD